jgi:hypothetical protein
MDAAITEELYSATCSYKLHHFSFDDMQRFAMEAWGELGTNTVLRWSEFNDRFFGGVLRPIPLVISNTLPFGHMLAFCSDGGHLTTPLVYQTGPKTSVRHHGD